MSGAVPESGAVDYTESDSKAVNRLQLDRWNVGRTLQIPATAETHGAISRCIIHDTVLPLLQAIEAWWATVLSRPHVWRLPDLQDSKL